MPAVPQAVEALFCLYRCPPHGGDDPWGGEEDKLIWYQSSKKARRGFCCICGASLFWDPLFRDWIAIAMGAFDTPTNTKLALHIFTADKGDYYEIGDGATQFQRVPEEHHAPCPRDTCQLS